MSQIRIGTRASPLALAQANKVAAILAQNFGILANLVPIVTTGDKIKDKALYEIGGKSLFLKELEEALQQNQVDIAVHSLKDIPGKIATGLKIAAVLKRRDPRDAIISVNNYSLETLPFAAKIGTSSSRRRVQLLKIRPDLQIFPCRGNIDTRINKLYEGNFDAIILAKAGIERLKLDVPVSPINTDIMPPAPGQGVIALQINEKNYLASDIAQKLNDSLTWQIIQAERGFVEKLNATCRTPIAAYAKLNETNNLVEASYMLSDFEGSNCLTKTIICNLEEAYEASVQVAEEFMTQISTLEPA